MSIFDADGDEFEAVLRSSSRRSGNTNVTAASRNAASFSANLASTGPASPTNNAAYNDVFGGSGGGGGTGRAAGSRGAGGESPADKLARLRRLESEKRRARLTASPGSPGRASLTSGGIFGGGGGGGGDGIAGGGGGGTAVFNASPGRGPSSPSMPRSSAASAFFTQGYSGGDVLELSRDEGAGGGRGGDVLAGSRGRNSGEHGERGGRYTYTTSLFDDNGSNSGRRTKTRRRKPRSGDGGGSGNSGRGTSTSGGGGGGGGGSGSESGGGAQVEPASSRTEAQLRQWGIETSYDPSTRGGHRGAGGGGSGTAGGPAPPVDVSNVAAFMHRPVLPGQLVQCTIVRNKARLGATYSLFLEDPDTHLVTSKKLKKRTAYYLVSLNENELSRDSESYFGKLRSNFVGTEFVIYSSGEAYGKARGREEVRRELGVILYASNVLGFKGPREMTVILPGLDEAGEPYIFRPRGDDDTILAAFNAVDYSQLRVLENKRPVWDEASQTYLLNFNKRVTEASVKNFQMIDPADPDDVLIQFGRVAEDEFTMDVAHPITPYQAFCICLSSFDNKLACE